MEILFDLACRLGLGDQFWEGDQDRAFQHWIEPLGIRLGDLKESARGISFPLPFAYQKHIGSGGFPTKTGRIEIYATIFEEHGYDPLPDFAEPPARDPSSVYPLIMTNTKVASFCHSSHRSIPSLRKRTPHPYVEIHPEDAQSRGITHGDEVIVETARGTIRSRAKVTDRIIRGVIATQHGWWQECPPLGLGGQDPFGSEGSNVNLLVVNDVLDPMSGTVPHRSTPCQVRRACAEREESRPKSLVR
jgi:anaerobic selenocysteine-containing dehydrogenase